MALRAADEDVTLVTSVAVAVVVMEMQSQDSFSVSSAQGRRVTASVL